MSCSRCFSAAANCLPWRGVISRAQIIYPALSFQVGYIFTYAEYRAPYAFSFTGSPLHLILRRTPGVFLGTCIFTYPLAHSLLTYTYDVLQVFFWEHASLPTRLHIQSRRTRVFLGFICNFTHSLAHSLRRTPGAFWPSYASSLTRSCVHAQLRCAPGVSRPWPGCLPWR